MLQVREAQLRHQQAGREQVLCAAHEGRERLKDEPIFEHVGNLDHAVDMAVGIANGSTSWLDASTNEPV